MMKTSDARPRYSPAVAALLRFRVSRTRCASTVNRKGLRSNTWRGFRTCCFESRLLVGAPQYVRELGRPEVSNPTESRHKPVLAKATTQALPSQWRAMVQRLLAAG
jgi:hypothetical protein